MSSRKLEHEKRKFKRTVIAATALSAFLASGFVGAPARAQESSAPATQPAQDQQASATSPGDSATAAASVSSAPAVQASKPAKQHTPFAIGVAVKASILGIGAEVAAPVTRRTNLRAAHTHFNYSRTLTSDGITYGGELDVRPLYLLYDLVPFCREFHLTPGLLAFN